MPNKFQLIFGEPGGWDIAAEFKSKGEAKEFLDCFARWGDMVDGDERIVRTIRAIGGSIEYLDDHWCTWVEGREITWIKR